MFKHRISLQVLCIAPSQLWMSVSKLPKAWLGKMRPRLARQTAGPTPQPWQAPTSIFRA